MELVISRSLKMRLQRIISRCLEKDKSRRYQNADEIIADLRMTQQEVSATPKVQTASGRKGLRMALILAAALSGAALLLFYVLTLSNSDSVDRKSIAVLPLKNLSEEKENEYFSDGITEDIIAQLSKIGDLKVISRTSVMRYKNTDKSLREIGSDLGVAVVLEGSVRRSDNRVRIVSQLIDARTDENLWGETYDRELTEIFAIQSDVAQQIASALRAKLSPAEKRRINTS